MSQHISLKRISLPVIPLIAGSLFPFGFAPFEYTLVAPLTTGVLFLLWSSEKSRTAAIFGLYFGLGAFLVGVSWVFISLHSYGNMPAPLAALVVAVFVFIMGLYPALCGFLQGFFWRLPRLLRMLVVMPIFWVLLEWLRSRLFGGFPWLLLGYSQADTVLGSWAPISGVFSVSLASAVTGSAVIMILIGTLRERITAVVVVIVVFASAILVKDLVFVLPDGKPIKIAVIQNNIPLTQKWNPNAAEDIANNYLETSANEIDADLIVWPESAIPIYFDQLPTIFLRQLLEHPSDYLFGVLERTTDSPSKYFNSAVGVSSDFALYRKRQLVMFGEYLPMPFLFRWILNYLDIPMSVFTSWGYQQSPMQLADRQVGVTICYEDAFQSRVTEMLPEATVLANISEDAWFGDSLASWQRLQIARMRALEARRPIIRSSNNGLSALINHFGKVIEMAPMFESVVLRGEVQPMTGTTPFIRFGNLPLFFVLGLGLIVCLWRIRVLRKGSRVSTIGSDNSA